MTQIMSQKAAATVGGAGYDLVHGKHLRPGLPWLGDRGNHFDNGETTVSEKDPNGLDADQPGAKLDAGKPKYMFVLQSFPDALAAVNEVGEYGAEKYSPDGWRHVSEGIVRYSNALVRHMTPKDPRDKSGLHHDAMAAWNALARLQLRIERDG